MLNKAILRAKIVVIIFMLSAFSSLVSAQDLNVLKAQYKRPNTIPFPANNPYSAAKAQLGKMLFFDQRLSRHFNLNCASCHNPSLGWEDGVAGATGDQNTQLGRNSPTILNMAWGNKFFWDGRAESLEAQAIGPIEANVEMNTPIELVIERLEKVDSYQQQFQQVFGDGISAQNIFRAIATYERTIVSGTAPFDRWIEGDADAISEQAKRGFALFNGKAECSKCHRGWNFTDNQFYDIGLPSPDRGRYEVTKRDDDMFAFKTPSLRSISQRQPYMHDGSMQKLEEVVIHYISGGIRRPSLSEKMKPLALDQSDVAALVAFMHTLEGEDKPVSLPILPL